jgi:A/G-specific adenine glycosylase
VARDHGGAIPDDPSALRQLPGIGDYTAAAIASVAFDRPAAAVDGNVIRVLARIEGLRGSRVSPRLKRDVTRRAVELASGPRSGDWTQALMELGAVLCLPRDPRCGRCPARALCRANASGRPGRYPEAPAAKEPRRVERVMLAAWSRGRLFVVRETAGSPGAWAIPHAETEGDPGRAARALARRLGSSGTVDGPVARFRHRTFAEDSEVEVWRLASGLPAAPGRWVAPRDVDRLPTRGPTLKALKRLLR